MGCGQSSSSSSKIVQPAAKSDSKYTAKATPASSVSAGSPKNLAIIRQDTGLRTDLEGTYYNSTWETCLGLLSICVKDASDMPAFDRKGKNDPFCVISFGHQSSRTKTIFNNSNPVWDQTATVSVDSTQSSFSVHLAVYDKDIFSSNDVIGVALLPIQKYIDADEKTVTETVQLFPGLREAEAMTGAHRGQLRVELRFTKKENVAMKFWRSLSEVFDKDNDGTISREELAMMLEGLGSSVSENELDEIYASADLDRDGSISREELYRFMSSMAANKFLDIQECPVCHRSLAGSRDRDVAMHLAQCFEAGPNSAEKYLVGGFMCSDHAVHGWLKEMVDGGRAKSFEQLQGKGYILVQERTTGVVHREKLAPFVTMPLRIMYQTLVGRFAAERAKKALTKMSVVAGKKYDEPGSTKHIDDFIEYYKISTDEMLDSKDSFRTFNEFFYRKLKPTARTIAAVGNDNVAVSPADCRSMVFDKISDATRLWVKGKHFTILNLLGGDPDLAQKFDGGSLMIARLAPQDYHRYHMPVSGTVTKISDIPGGLYTVSPLAVNEEVDVFTENKRMLTQIETDAFGLVVIVTIGATMVGSINMAVKEGDVVGKGDEHGYFAFGGSTELVLFRPGTIRFDPDLLANSVMPIETKLEMGMSIGVSCADQSSESL